jgi:DNA-binding NarL/FixJ family response regulator
VREQDATRSASLRVVIVDDHPVFRRGLRALLEAAGIQVVAEAADGRAALDAVPAHHPDLVLMDLHLPGINGIDVTRRLVRELDVRICVLTMFDDDDSVFAAMRAGALGYLLKGADQEQILRAVQAVAAGEALFGPLVARRMQAFFASGGDLRAVPFPELTPREREVLELLAAGQDNAAIASRLGVSTKTIRNSVSSIFAKLRVADRAQAMIRAREAGLGN